MNNPAPKWWLRLEIIFAGCMLLYIIAKASFVPITYDEAYTIEHYATLNVQDIMRSPQAFNLANNHVLNTLVVKAMIFFTKQPLLLRLPNILACILFLFSSHLIAKRLFPTDYLLSFLLFAALSLNPMLAEFFALARGYGMGIAFETFSLGQLMLISNQSRGKGHLHLCYIAGILAVYSTFSMLLPVLSIGALAFFYSYRNETKTDNRFINAAWPLGIYSGILLWLIYRPITYLIEAKALFHGGTRNFIQDTWASMISDLAGLRPRNFEAFDSGNYTSRALVIWVVLSIILLLAAFFLTIRKAGKNNRSRENSALFFPGIILAACILVINAQFYLQGTRFINYRVALYLYPLSILVIFTALKLYYNQFRMLTRRAGMVLVVLLGINYCLQLKVTYTTEWPFDAYNKQVCIWIKNDRATQPAKARLYAFTLMQPAINFYIRTQYNAVLAPVPEIGNVADIDPVGYDYIYLPRSSATVIHPPFQVVQSYEDSTYLLFKKF